MAWLLAHLQDILAVIGGASAIAAVTPTKKDDTILGALSQLIHLVALNFGQAANKK